MNSPNKTKLITAIQELLQKGFVTTQEDICTALSKRGHTINQVKVSRILHKLGAIKLIENGQTVYRLPTEMVAIAPQYSLKQLVLSINHNETLVVINTAPGSAQLVARLLDQKKQLGILGTVAGDDTIFVAPESTKTIRSVMQKISSLLLA